MLGSLLEKLSSLLPKSFMLAAFLPVAAVSFVNALLIYAIHPDFRQTYRQIAELTAVRQTMVGVPVLASLFIVAGVLSVATGSLRQALEGAYFRGVLKDILIRSQRRKLSQLEKRLSDDRYEWFKLRTGQNSWKGQLKAARLKGNTSTAPCKYSNTNATAVLINHLLKVMEQNERIAAADLEEAVLALEQELTACSLSTRNPNAPDEKNKRLLNEHQVALGGRLTQYAVGFAEKNYREQYGRRDLYYSRYVLAPTAMGNIAESIRGYARSRYHINLDFIWSRLLKVVQEDESFSGFLSDANTRLDAIIGLFWLTVFSTILWLAYLLYFRRNPLLFLAIGVAGPALAAGWYRIGLQSYLAFAEVLRTAIDLYRFKLLTALHVGLPLNSAAELNTWATLNQVIGYGIEENLDYQHPAKEE